MRPYDVDTGESKAVKCKEGDIRGHQTSRMDLDHKVPNMITDRQAMQGLDQNIIISQ